MPVTDRLLFPQGVVSGATLGILVDAPLGCAVQTALPPDPFGPGVADRYRDGLVPQGISAELIAAKWNLSRAELDEFSAASHHRAAAA